MSIIDRTLEQIWEGQSGRILAIPTRVPKVDQFIYGTRQGTYYLYGAETGVGKTTYVREKHMHVPYEIYKEINNPEILDLFFVDFSLEISAEINMGAAITRKLFKDEGLVIPLDHLFRWDQAKPLLTDVQKAKIEALKPYFRDFQQKMLVVDRDVTPTLFHDVLMEVAKRFGTFEHEGNFISECSGYKMHNPNLYVIVPVDTINLADMDSGHDTIKSSIDRMSRIAVWFRNKCNFTFCFLQQFNAEISAVDRGRYGIKTPLLRDFEDSKRTTKDANIVFGMFDPMRHMREDEKIFAGYDITILKSWFRSLHLLKNRNGFTSKVIPLKFDGEVGVFTQLPDANQMGELAYMAATRH